MSSQTGRAGGHPLSVLLIDAGVIIIGLAAYNDFTGGRAGTSAGTGLVGIFMGLYLNSRVRARGAGSD